MSRKVVVNGVEYRSLNKACKELGVGYMTVYSRIENGMSIDEAFSMVDNRKNGILFDGLYFRNIEEAERYLGVAPYEDVNLEPFLAEDFSKETPLDRLKRIKSSRKKFGFENYDWSFIGARCYSSPRENSDWFLDVDELSSNLFFTKSSNSKKEAVSKHRARARAIGAVGYTINKDLINWYYPVESSDGSELKYIVVGQDNADTLDRIVYTKFDVRKDYYIVVNEVNDMERFREDGSVVSYFYGFHIVDGKFKGYERVPSNALVRWALGGSFDKVSLEKVIPEINIDKAVCEGKLEFITETKTLGKSLRLADSSKSLKYYFSPISDNVKVFFEEDWAYCLFAFRNKVYLAGLTFVDGKLDMRMNILYNSNVCFCPRIIIDSFEEYDSYRVSASVYGRVSVVIDFTVDKGVVISRKVSEEMLPVTEKVLRSDNLELEHNTLGHKDREGVYFIKGSLE